MFGRWSLMGLAVAIFVGWEYRRRFDFPSVTPEKLRKNGYDFIVGNGCFNPIIQVGAGSAGAALASRLSEDASKSVLLIEAGNTGASVPFSHIPGLVPFLQKSAIDWAFETRPQEHAQQGMKGKKSLWPRGKILGGSSVLNYMLHVRARRSDYERWEKTHGLKGWGWADVEPFYRRMESFPEGGQGRGTSGPIGAGRMPESPEFSALWAAGVKELGMPSTPDYNGPDGKGWSRMQTSVRNGKRQSTAMTYLEQAKKRPNLHVLVDSTASRVLFDGKRASGVEIEWATDGRLHQASTKKTGEVILSSGSIGSPQLLLLSGIGDPKQLAEFKIPVVADVPAVGQNLQDHIIAPMYFKVNQSLGVDWHHLASFGFLHLLAQATWSYNVHGTGPLSDMLLPYQALVDSGLPGAPTDSADLQLYVVPTHIMGDLGERNVGLRPEVEAAESGRIDGGHFVITIGSCLQQPQSVGSIRLASADFHQQPDIDPKYLSKERDVKAIVKGLKDTIKIIHSRSLAHLNPQTMESKVPGCESFEQNSDPYLECLVRHKGMTLYHPTSTCRMGNDPKTSVVDDQLRVRGVKKLRVADASVFPDIVSGNTNLPSILIGEKLAAMLLKE